MKTTVPKLRKMIRKVIQESERGKPFDTWGVGSRTDHSSRQPTLPETLEVIEIIESHGGEYSSSVYEMGEEYSNNKREVIIGRAGDAVFNVIVTPNSFHGTVREEKGYEQAELPGQKGRVNPNDFFARGKDFVCSSVEEFEQCMQDAMVDYARPVRSRKRRSGARKAGYEHFRTK